SQLTADRFTSWTILACFGSSFRNSPVAIFISFNRELLSDRQVRPRSTITSKSRLTRSQSKFLIQRTELSGRSLVRLRRTNVGPRGAAARRKASPSDRLRPARPDAKPERIVSCGTCVTLEQRCLKG